MNPDEQKITELVLVTIAEFPLKKRASYLRSLSRLCSAQDVVVRLSAQADALDLIAAKHHQLVLDLKLRGDGPSHDGVGAGRDGQ